MAIKAGAARLVLTLKLPPPLLNYSLDVRHPVSTILARFCARLEATALGLQMSGKVKRTLSHRQNRRR